MRVENSSIRGTLDGGTERFSHNYTDFFPSFSFSLDLPWKGSQNISMSVNRYISRPFYSSLNPFTVWSSETTCSKGNVNLRPSYAWYFSLCYSFLKNFVFGANYSADDDTELDYTYRQQDVTVSSSKNFGTVRNASGFLTYNRTFGGFWRIKASTRLSYNAYEAWLDDTDLSRKSCTFSIKILKDFPGRHPLSEVRRFVRFKNKYS